MLFINQPIFDQNNFCLVEKEETIGRTKLLAHKDFTKLKYQPKRLPWRIYHPT